MTRRVALLAACLVAMLSTMASTPASACWLCVREKVCEPEIPCYWVTTCQAPPTLVTGYEDCDDSSGCQTLGRHCIWT